MTKQSTYKGVYKRGGGGEVRSRDFTAFYTLISYYTILYTATVFFDGQNST